MRSLGRGGWIVLAILCYTACSLAAAAAIEVTDLSLLYRGQDLTSVQFAKDYPVDVHFTVSGDDLDQIEEIHADLADLNANPAFAPVLENIPLSLDQCLATETGYDCVIRDKTLNILDADLSFTFTFILPDGQQEATVDKTLTKNTDRPEATFLGTAGCADGGQCYVHNGLNDVVVKLEGSSTGFSQRRIFYAFTGSGISYPANCTNTVCIGTATAVCQDGQSATLRLTGYNGMPSQDDAGLPVRGVTSATLVCDNIPPEIKSLAISPATGGETVTGSPIRIIADVQEATSPVFISADFSALGGTTEQTPCALQDGLWHCELSTTQYDPGPYEADIAITVMDAAGNKVSQTIRHTILKLNTQSGNDFWTIKDIQYAPQVFNIRFLTHADNTVYAYATLQPKINGARVAGVQTGVCTAVEKEAKVTANLKLYGDYHDQDALLFRIELSSQTPGLNSVTFSCPIKLFTSYQNAYYQNPEAENLTIKISYIDHNDIGSNIQEEIARVRKEEQERQDKLNQLRSIAQVAQPACTAMIGVQQTSAVAATVAAITEPIPFAQPVSESTFRLSKGTQGLFGTLSKEPTVLMFCRAMSCNPPLVPIASVLEEMPGTEEALKVAGYGSDADYEMVFDPYKSQYLAYASACIPAIIATSDRAAAIQCEYAQCLSAGTKQGMPLAQCKAAKEYDECRYVVGNIMEILPHTALLRRLGETVKAVLGDPITFFTTAGSAVVCEVIPEKTAYAACKVPKAISAVGSLKQLLSNWIDIGKPSAEKDYCDYVLENIEPSSQHWIPYVNEPTINPQMTYADGTVACDPYIGCHTTQNSYYSVLYIGPDNKAGNENPDNFVVFDTQTGRKIGTIGDWAADTKQFTQPAPATGTGGSTPGGTTGGTGSGDQPDNLPTVTYADVADSSKYLNYNDAAATPPEEGEQPGLSEEEYQAMLRQEDACEKWGLSCDPAKDNVKTNQLQLLKKKAALSYNRDLNKIFSSSLSSGANQDFIDYYYGTEGTQYEGKGYLDIIDENEKAISSLQEDISTANAYVAEKNRNINNLKQQLDKPGTTDQEKAEIKQKIKDAEQDIKDVSKIIDDNADQVEDLQDEMADAQEELDKKNAKRFSTQEFHDQFRNDPWNAYGEMLRMGRSFSGFVNMLDIDAGWIRGWRNTFDNIMHADVFEWLTGDFESRFCDSNVRVDGVSAGQVFVQGAGNTLYPAAHVEGERSQLISLPGERPFYNYFVTANVMPKEEPLSSQPLHISLILRTGGQTLVLEDVDLDANSPTYSTGTEGIVQNSTILFNQVCIRFSVSHKRDLYTYFDYLNDDMDTEVCNDLFAQ